MFRGAAHVTTHDGKYIVVQGNFNQYFYQSPSNPQDLSRSAVYLNDEQALGQHLEGMGALVDSEDSVTVDSQTTEHEAVLSIAPLEDMFLESSKRPVSAGADPQGSDLGGESLAHSIVPKSRNPFAYPWSRSRTRITEDKIIRDARVTDIVIPIMGPTGVGKSTFINTLLGTSTMAVGHESSPCTVTLQHAFISHIPNHPSLIGRRIVLVDTPGFDNNPCHKRISSWLASSYNTDMRFPGLIYLHDISQSPNKMPGPTRRTSEMLRYLCGEDVEAAVILGTTKWGQIESRTGEQREEELRVVCRKNFPTGTKVYRYDDSEKSAWRIVDAILARFEQTLTMESKDSFSDAPLENVSPLPQSISLSFFSDSPISQNSKSPLLGSRPASIQPLHSSLAPNPTLLLGDQTLNITNEDTIVAVMGPTGTGKSSFINTLMRSAVAVTGDDLSSCTPEVTAFGCLHPDGSGRKVVIVDTPGFDDSEGMDYQILKAIARWLEQTYERRITLTGILQFHRIAESRMGGTPLMNLRMFELLCGADALKNVILTTTSWDQVTEEVGGMREAQLISEFWNPMIRRGSRVARFQPSTYESAWGIIDQFSATIHTTTPRPALKVQTEMVVEKKTVEETSAFKFLARWWDRVLSRVKGFGGMRTKRNRSIQLKASEVKLTLDSKRLSSSTGSSSGT